MPILFINHLPMEEVWILTDDQIETSYPFITWSYY